MYLFNNVSKTVVLMGGRLHLKPVNTTGYYRPINDAVLREDDVKRMIDKKAIVAVSDEEAKARIDKDAEAIINSVRKKALTAFNAVYAEAGIAPDGSPLKKAPAAVAAPVVVAEPKEEPKVEPEKEAVIPGPKTPLIIRDAAPLTPIEPIVDIPVVIPLEVIAPIAAVVADFVPTFEEEAIPEETVETEEKTMAVTFPEFEMPDPDKKQLGQDYESKMKSGSKKNKKR